MIVLLLPYYYTAWRSFIMRPYSCRCSVNINIPLCRSSDSAVYWLLPRNARDWYYYDALRDDDIFCYFILMTCLEEIRSIIRHSWRYFFCNEMWKKKRVSAYVMLYTWYAIMYSINVVCVCVIVPIDIRDNVLSLLMCVCNVCSVFVALSIHTIPVIYWYYWLLKPVVTTWKRRTPPYDLTFWNILLPLFYDNDDFPHDTWAMACSS